MAAWPSFGELATLLVTAAGIDVWEMFHTPTIANSRQAKKEGERSEQKKSGEERERERKKRRVWNRHSQCNFVREKSK